MTSVRRDLPAGTVTFLFSDVEGSTRLLHELGAARYAEALAEHRRVLRDAFGAHGGVEVDTQGDAFFVAFPTAPGALRAAAEGLKGLSAGPIRVRIGIHTGTPHVAEEGYVGVDVHRAARIAACGHGGQVLLSASTASLLDDDELRDLGEHRLKDLSAPERIYQLGDAEFPPLGSLHQTNLPIASTPFLGREKELGEVLGLLTQDEVRLLTLTGPGGTGKTRLAAQAAAELGAGYPHGVWWVPLAALRDPTLVLATAAQALGASAGLAEHIADRSMLLLFDNFEQVVEAAADVAALLTTCPNLDLLVTSREPLHVSGEQEYPVPPLVHEEGVGFFLARARAVKPGFDAGEAVSEICLRLDELPLALELAAARVKALSANQILERLEQRLPLLTGGARDLPERQRTLRATIAWSHDLLTEDEQRQFARLAVFSGGCTLEAAEKVTGADLDRLQSLVAKSLLRHTEERFWMLETIREFAFERLEESGEAETVRRRHAEHYLELAESANLSVEALGRGPQRHDLVLPEQHNLRDAIDWATGADVELGLRLAVSLDSFWITNDPSEGVRRFELLLERYDGPDLVLRARALRDFAGCATMAGDPEQAQSLNEQALELCREAGDPRGATEMIFRLGANAFFAGDLELGRRLHEESLEGFRRLGDQIGELQALGNLGWFEFEHGDRERGWELTEQSLAMAREAGWVWWIGGRLCELAERSLEDARSEAADRYAREFLEIARSTGDREAAVYGLAQLAWAAAERGDPARAVVLWSAVEAEEARGKMPRWDPYRDRYAVHIPDAPRPVTILPLDRAVEYALSA